MKCVRCEKEKGAEFYKNDSSCKDCRKDLVRKNRADKAEYYRAYDRKRFQEDPRVKARHKRYQQTEVGMDAARRAKRKYHEQNPVKRAAHTILGNAVRDGRIKKPPACSECGHEGRVHGHHDDYAEPLKVKWLCPKCHTQWHNENGEGEHP